jgi:hypothetical protein
MLCDLFICTTFEQCTQVSMVSCTYRIGRFYCTYFAVNFGSDDACNPLFFVLGMRKGFEMEFS